MGVRSNASADDNPNKYEHWRKLEFARIDSENKKLHDRIRHARSLVPAGPPEIHFGAVAHTQSVLRTVKLPEVAKQRLRGFVKPIDEHYLKKEAEELEKVLMEVAWEKRHLLQRKVVRFKKKPPKSDRDSSAGRGTSTESAKMGEGSKLPDLAVNTDLIPGADKSKQDTKLHPTVDQGKSGEKIDALDKSKDKPPEGLATTPGKKGVLDETRPADPKLETKNPAESDLKHSNVAHEKPNQDEGEHVKDTKPNTEPVASPAKPQDAVKAKPFDKPKPKAPTEVDDLGDFFGDPVPPKPATKPALQPNAAKDQVPIEPKPTPAVVDKKVPDPKKQIDDLDDFFGDSTAKPAVNPANKPQVSKPVPTDASKTKPVQPAATNPAKPADEELDFFGEPAKKDPPKPQVAVPKPGGLPGQAKPTIAPGNKPKVVPAAPKDAEDDLFGDIGTKNKPAAPVEEKPRDKPETKPAAESQPKVSPAKPGLPTTQPQPGVAGPSKVTPAVKPSDSSKGPKKPADNLDFGDDELEFLGTSAKPATKDTKPAEKEPPKPVAPVKPAPTTNKLALEDQEDDIFGDLPAKPAPKQPGTIPAKSTPAPGQQQQQPAAAKPKPAEDNFFDDFAPQPTTTAQTKPKPAPAQPSPAKPTVTQPTKPAEANPNTNANNGTTKLLKVVGVLTTSSL